MAVSGMRGAAAMVATIQKIAAKFPDRVAASIYKQAQLIMTESKKICPVARDGGILRASGQVAPPVRSGRNISVTMSYGGAADAYAIAVHEHPSDYSPPSWVTHPYDIAWTTPGTGPKFLEKPINDIMPQLAELIAQDVNFKNQGQ